MSEMPHVDDENHPCYKPDKPPCPSDLTVADKRTEHRRARGGHRRRLAAAVLIAASLFGGGIARAASVTNYHNAADRGGAYVVPGLTLQSAATLHRDKRFDGRVPGPVYAQPLFWSHQAGGRRW